MIAVRRIQCGIVNCYLLNGRDGSILIETGNPRDADKIMSALNGVPVSLILLTHGHTDHCGSAAALRERLKAPIAIHAADVELIGNPSARKLYCHTILGRILAKASASTMENSKFTPFASDVLIGDGFDLSQYGIPARVVALPGHTQGSVGVLVDQGGMIVGDAAFHMLKPTGARLYGDHARMEESVAKIKLLCSDQVYVGHGKPIKASEI